MTGINEVAKEIHKNAVAHGWWEEDRGFPEIIALCHSELSEALEEYRNGRPNVYFPCKLNGDVCDEYVEYESEETKNEYACDRAFKSGEPCEHISDKPEGIAVEMADCIIRILDWCGKEGIDIDAIITQKHEYNKSRPYRHGGKKC